MICNLVRTPKILVSSLSRCVVTSRIFGHNYVGVEVNLTVPSQILYRRDRNDSIFLGVVLFILSYCINVECCTKIFETFLNFAHFRMELRMCRSDMDNLLGTGLLVINVTPL